jgi:hypothetical protein
MILYRYRRAFSTMAATPGVRVRVRVRVRVGVTFL